MSMREFGCGQCSLVIDDVQYTAEPSTPVVDIVDLNTGALISRDGPVLICPLCGAQEWLYFPQIFPVAGIISEKTRPPPYNPWVSLKAEREVFPIRSNFVKKTIYKDRKGRDRVHRQNLTFNTKREYEGYMERKGFMYYEEPSVDVRDVPFVNERHKTLHARFSEKFEKQLKSLHSTHRFMTEQELQNANSIH